MIEFYALKGFFVAVHLVGVVIGAGSAYFGDYTFMGAMRSNVVTPERLARMGKVSRNVWIGVLIIVLSGVGLFLGDPTGYLASDKFIAKMIIVAVVIINGAVLHFVHFKVLEQVVGEPLKTSLRYRKASFGMHISGGVSAVSWASAIVLGFFHSVPLSLSSLLGIYVLLLALSIGGSLVVRSLFFRGKLPMMNSTLTQNFNGGN